jgi:hypothetical protein
LAAKKVGTHEYGTFTKRVLKNSGTDKFLLSWLLKKKEVLTGIWQRVGSQWEASNCRLVRLEGAALLLNTPSQPTTPNNNAHSRI